MSDNYSQATVSPRLPASLFTAGELASLSSACGLACERHGDLLYFFAEEHFREQDDDGEGSSINCTAMFQEKLRQLPAGDYPAIIIEGAATCSKLREGEFGGFAYFITRDEVRYASTWQWLHAQDTAKPPGDMPHAAAAPAAGRPFSVLLLYPDYSGDTGYETYYAFVQATGAIEAVAAAQIQAAAAQPVSIDDPTDFHPLLVTEGHHASLPLFNR